MNSNEIRKLFPTIKNNFTYLDSASSSLTPNCVINAISKYYKKYSCNLYRGEYFSSTGLESEIDEARSNCASMINVSSSDEIIFTSGATEASNMLVSMLFNSFKSGDEVIISPHAHSSLFGPTFMMAKAHNLKIIIVKLLKNGSIDLLDLKNKINSKTKGIFLSHVTNLYGKTINIRNINKIRNELCKESILVVDAAQSVSHTKIDVKKMGCDFLFFSGHKMFGPTGVGVLWGREKLLLKLTPSNWGGGQITNLNFKDAPDLILKNIPYRFETGTLPLASIMGLSEAVKFQNKIGLDFINNHIKSIRNYALSKLNTVQGIRLHSNKSDLNVVFSIEGFAVHDIATHLATKKIDVRGGQHCAQLLSVNFTPHPRNTIRLSFQIYTSYDDIDTLVLELKKGKKVSYLDGFVK